MLLQVLDDGRLTDGQGRTVDFKNRITSYNVCYTKLLRPGFVRIIVRGPGKPTLVRRDGAIGCWTARGFAASMARRRLQLFRRLPA